MNIEVKPIKSDNQINWKKMEFPQLFQTTLNNDYLLGLEWASKGEVGVRCLNLNTQEIGNYNIATITGVDHDVQVTFKSDSDEDVDQEEECIDGEDDGFIDGESVPLRVSAEKLNSYMLHKKIFMKSYTPNDNEYVLYRDPNDKHNMIIEIFKNGKSHSIATADLDEDMDSASVDYVKSMISRGKWVLTGNEIW